MKEFTDVRLVTPDDAGYRRLSSGHADAWRAQRPRDPHAAECTRLFAALEVGMRRLVAAHAPVQGERILSFLHVRGHPPRQLRTYRELDCVIGVDGTPVVIIEIKTRVARKASTGTAQLAKSLHISRLRWPAVRGLWLETSLQSVLDSPGDPIADCDTLQGLWRELAQPSSEPGPVRMRLDGMDVVSTLQDAGYLSTTFPHDLRRALGDWADPIAAWHAAED